MAEERSVRHRGPLGIFEAALLLVVAGMVLWLLRPLPAARAAAEAEKRMASLLDALADAEDALPRGTPFLPLPALLARDPALRERFAGAAAGPDGVLGAGEFWVAVLLPDRDGMLRGPGSPDGTGAARGYAVLAWPRRGASRLLRSLAALPGNGAWQRADGMEEPGDPALPPVPRAGFPEGGGRRAPEPPPDWVKASFRRGARE
ncbi:MAG: hypothetical protein L6R43_11885 [Planctomycetes bacterium]|nr:hypothetical protein [Planctomycetota bacterium]